MWRACRCGLRQRRGELEPDALPSTMAVAYMTPAYAKKLADTSAPAHMVPWLPTAASTIERYVLDRSKCNAANSESRRATALCPSDRRPASGARIGHAEPRREVESRGRGRRLVDSRPRKAECHGSSTSDGHRRRVAGSDGDGDVAKPEARVSCHRGARCSGMPRARPASLDTTINAEAAEVAEKNRLCALCGLCVYCRVENFGTCEQRIDRADPIF